MDYSSARNVEATEPKLTRRERENLRQRDDIFEAALRLFSERGYHNVSMSQIAGEAEFGIGTLYKFFDNKENLYKALIMEKDSSHVSMVADLFFRGVLDSGACAAYCQDKCQLRSSE